MAIAGGMTLSWESLLISTVGLAGYSYVKEKKKAKALTPEEARLAFFAILEKSGLDFHDPEDVLSGQHRPHNSSDSDDAFSDWAEEEDELFLRFA